MTRTDVVIDRLRRLKARLTTRSALLRSVVPLVEVAEFWLSHGFREVVIRSRLRLKQPRTPPSRRPFYALPVDPGGPLPHVILPAPVEPVRASIVIPVLNNAFLTHHCLESIAQRTARGQYEVIVVDNGSDERTRQMLVSARGLRLITNASNVGFVEACNQGAAAARGEFVVFLNNDAVVLPDWLDHLIATAERDGGIGAVGAKLVYPDGRLQEAGGIIWSDGEGWNYGRLGSPDAPDFNFVRDVDYCSAACLLVRRSLFEDLGGFDLRYAPAYYEDVDLCFRLWERGYRVLYQPLARVIHFEGATAGTDLASGFKRYQAINHATFVARHSRALLARQPHDPARVRLARNRRPGKRILVVDHMVPHHDHDAGSVRMMALLTMLVELGHAVSFLPDNLARMEPYTTELQQFGIEVVHGPVSAIGFVESTCEEFDVAILCRAYFAAKYLPALLGSERRPFIIFDTVDLHFLREQRLAELQDDPALARSADRTREVELSVMRDSDAVWVTSTHEASLLRGEVGVARVDIVPMIHTVRDEVPAFDARRNLLFIGSFRHPPNEDAVLYFVQQIMPRVRQALPGVQLHIVGAHAPRSVAKLACEDVIVRGHVRDVRPLFDSCRLSVAPLRYGAGVKGKVTQSLAWGVPAVVTPIAAEGLELASGEHLLVAPGPEEFAAAVVALYQDEALWTRLSHNGRRRVATHLGYEAIRDSVQIMIDGAMRRPSVQVPTALSANV